jgi:hypothetical protein
MCRFFLVISVISWLGRGTWAAPCPSGKTLLEVARTAFPEERSLDLAHVSCRVVHEHARARWLIVFDMETAGLDIALTSGRHVDWTCCGRALGGPPSASIIRIEAGDLDGDGTDELLATVSHQGHEGVDDERLYVHAPTRALALYEEGGILLAWRDRHRDDCWSTWRVVAGSRTTRRLEVIGHCARGGRDLFGSGDFPTETRAYSWRDGELVEATAR